MNLDLSYKVHLRSKATHELKALKAEGRRLKEALNKPSAFPQGLKSVRETGLSELEKNPLWVKSGKLAPLCGDSKLASQRSGRISRRS